MKLRVGLVGVGGDWNRRHRPAFKSLGDRFEVRAVCSDVAARAEQVAAEFGAEVSDGFQVLAARKDIEAIMVLSSSWYGATPVLAACENGKAIYCSGVFDTDLAEAELIRRRVEASGVAYVAELPRRYAPATIRLKELIATRLGQPQFITCHRRDGPSNGAVPYRHRPLREITELIDWCCYTMGMPASNVTGVKQELHADDSLAGEFQTICLGFPDRRGQRPLAQINLRTFQQSAWKSAAAFRAPAELEVSCEHGIAFVDLPSTLVWFDSAGQHHESLSTDTPVGEQLLTQFHRAVTSLVRRNRDLEDAHRCLHAAISAERSALEGRLIELD